MHIEAVDFFYLAMPEVTDEADGSQDALLVRVAAGGHIGWGECEAAPLPSIAAFCCPKSHGVCRPVADSVLGKRLARSGRHRAHRRGGRLQFDGPAAGAAYVLRHRDGAVGSARAGARRAGVAPARLSAQLRQDALRLGAVRRHAGRDARARQGDAGAQFHRGEIRLGPDRARRCARRRGAFRCRARGPRGRRDAARRYRADFHRRCGARGRTPARARSRARDLVRGAVRGECAGSLRRARAAQPPR